jgi:hypothetical protein
MAHPTEGFFCRTKAFWSIATGREKTGACFAAMILAVNIAVVRI